MPILSFDAAAVANLIQDARSATSFIPKWDGPITTPGFVLVVDQGIYLMSNAAAVPVAHDAEQLPAKPRAFAAGFNPDNSISTQCLTAYQRISIFSCIDIVGYQRNIVVFAHG